MNTILWILQALLAVVMVGPGLQKLSQTKDQLVASGSVDWAEDFTPAQIKTIGVLEVAAAIGLLLPPILDVAPVLSALAATGVVLTMIGAGKTHLRRGERSRVPVSVVIGLLALFVAVERFGPHAF
jgi:uncharacterized membrane protein YphA (DoxX/SURF4 family)